MTSDPRRTRFLARFRPGDPKPPETDAFVERLRAIPQNPQRLTLGSYLPWAVKNLGDFLSSAPPWVAKARGRFQPYPEPFQRVEIPSGDGITLTGWLGIHTADEEGGDRTPLPRQGVLVVPGLFSSKDNLAHRTRAVRFFRDWGYHVLSVDLRSMGESERVYSSLGWKESEDIEAALAFFRGHAPIEKLHVYAESLGAVAVLLAAGRQARRGIPLVDGGILAICPFAQAKTVVSHVTRRPKPGRWESVVYINWFYQRLLELGGLRHASIQDYLKAAARSYGTSYSGLLRRSSPVRVVKDIGVPTLIVMSEDDPLIPTSEIDRFEAALRRRTNPTLFRLGWGNHALFELLDPQWFWNVCHEFFDFYCTLPSVPAGKR